nr:hypothetical protein [Lachnospiraceae bacterium]
MKTMEHKLREEAGELKIIAEKAKKRLAGAPEGNLRVAKKRGKPEYYYKTKHDKERYLKKEEKQLVRALAQRDYDRKVVKNTEERIKAIESFLEKYERTSAETLFESIKPCRRELIRADLVTDAEYIRAWQEIEYKGKAFENCENEIVTDRGERVRSKSEKIIADRLYALGIPYRYECPLVLKPDIIVYPDFTILRMPERKEVYWEHLGKMDDMNYVEKMIYKLASYERNGIYPGDRLFMTFETGKKPINTRNLNDFIKTLFWAQ